MGKAIKKMALIALFVSLATIIQLCHLPKDTTKNSNSFISIRDQNFVDPEGRDIVLRGINVVNKDASTGYLGHVGPEDFEKFKRWGFNVVRLGIIWDGLEPEPGIYNEKYLHGIDTMIHWAAEKGIYVFLDMHQDLYGREFSDGAPAWATLTDGLPHETGEIWSDSYLISPAVQTAFDNFWKNTPASDGIGIQDHYLNLWKHIADRYKDNTTVIGFDIMNEPFMGSGANHVMPLLLQSYAKMLVETTGQALPSEEELTYMWSVERMEVLESLKDKEVYRNMIDAIYDVNAAFEGGELTAFFQKARDAIREVDDHHIIFTEHSYFTNMGVAGALGTILDEAGNPDSLVAYAAHGYDLVVDTEALALGSNDRVELIFERIAETGKRLNVPVLIGEWGALHGSSPDLIPVADFLLSEFARHGFSDTFWAYGEHVEKSSFLEVLKRPYPMSVSGKLNSFNFDFEAGVFTCTWQNNTSIDAPTKIYIPNLDKLEKDQISLTPDVESISLELIEGSEAGYLVVPSAGGNAPRTVTFTVSKNSEQAISLAN